MSKTKKLTFNMVAGHIDKAEDSVIQLFDDINIQVKHTLGVKEAMAFVHNIADSCYDLDKGEYTPEVFDIALRINVLMSYAGFEQQKDIGKAYDVVYNTDVFEKVLNVINPVQYSILVDAANERVKYARDILSSSAAAKIDMLIEKLDDVKQDNMNVIDQINSESFKEMVDKLSALGRGDNTTDAVM